MEPAGRIEIVLDQLRFGLRLVVLVKRVVVLEGLSTIVQRSDIIRINNHLPWAVQAGGLTRVDIRDKRRNLCGASTGEEYRTKNKCQAAEPIIHRRHSFANMQIFQMGLP